MGVVMGGRENGSDFMGSYVGGSGWLWCVYIWVSVGVWCIWMWMSVSVHC